MEEQMQFNVGEIIARSPRLETVQMVERFIEEHSGEYKKTELLNSLPKGIMWGTFNVILEYLYNSNKIGLDKHGKIIWINNPSASKKFINRKGY